MTHWFCIRLPRLPLEIFAPGGNERRPLAVSEGGRRPVVRWCNGAARRHGVSPGMSAAAAHALLPDGVAVRARDPAAEQTALRALADWALQFSSLISLRPDAVLLEDEGSLRLFGGRAALFERIRSGVSQLGYRARLASAPTPLSALALARCGEVQIVEECRQLPAALAPLPVSVLDWDQGLLDRLQGVGVRSLEELLRLPRDGLARRFGRHSLLYLDRLLGREPHLLQPYQAPVRFRRRLPLAAEVSHAGALLFALQRLVLELCGWLQGQGSGVARINIRLWQREGRCTPLEIVSHRESRDAGRFITLLRERLQRLQLRAPVLEVELGVEHPVPLDARPADLFGTDSGRDPVDLLDRLRARLGAEAVRGVSAVAEQRPEYAWRYSPPGEGRTDCIGQYRPLWLLTEPQRLATHDGRPCLQGALQLQPDRERIEAGWWDGRDIARDYFVAVNPAGSRYWIYRELRGERRWYLHGVFE